MAHCGSIYRKDIKAAPGDLWKREERTEQVNVAVRSDLDCPIGGAIWIERTGDFRSMVIDYVTHLIMPSALCNLLQQSVHREAPGNAVALGGNQGVAGSISVHVPLFFPSSLVTQSLTGFDHNCNSVVVCKQDLLHDNE